MKATLLLEDGTRFEGRALGAEGVRFGEVIFSTSLTGYQELLTDPSYRGQILVSTMAHVGNVGINKEDHESSRAWLSGFCVQDAPRQYSNWRATQSLHHWLQAQGVVSICDIDTRAVVKTIRRQGAMRGGICQGEMPSDFLNMVKTWPSLEEQDLVSQVTCTHSTTSGESERVVVAYDFGMKNYMLDLLVSHNLKVVRVPAHTPAKEILALEPSGVFLSNGPGDPAGLPEVVDQVKRLLGKVPMFGICLGHQLLARALGAETFKLKFGHHGTNHPVKDLSTGRVEITTQNHGFAVDGESLPDGVELTHINLNDGTCEGLASPFHRAFSVQYHPENAPGPQDSRYLFHRFVTQLEVGCCA